MVLPVGQERGGRAVTDVAVGLHCEMATCPQVSSET